MSASLALLLALQQIVVPFGNPPQVERFPAPLKENGPLWASVCKDNDGWDTPAPPVRIQGNTYLVNLTAADTGHLSANDTVVELTGTYTFANTHFGGNGTIHLMG